KARKFKPDDIIQQYRYFDGTKFVAGQHPDMKGTKWRVSEITRDYVEVVLWEGRYYWKGRANKKDYADVSIVQWFRSSDSYRQRFPGKKKTQQVFDEYKKVGEVT